MSYIGNSPITSAFLTDTFSGNGTTTAFTMSVAPANTSSVIVAITGVLQDPSTYSVSGTTLTFSAAPPTGTSNISVRYLGIPASGVTTTAYRTVTNFTATAGQTSFSTPSYTVGYIDVYRNGVRLASSDFVATTGTTVVLNNAATAGDTITTESFYVSSVLNALANTGGTLSGQLTINSATGQKPLIAQVNGTEVMEVDASGNVGIGTSSPAYKLDVTGASTRVTNGTRFMFNNIDVNGSGIWDTAGASGQGVYLNTASSYVATYTGSTERMRIDSSGNVGIGTTTMSNKLTVNGNATLYGTNPYITFSSVYNTTPAYIQSNTSTGELQIYTNGTGSNGFMTFYSGAGSERMRIDSSGNLLVGTTSTFGTLTVNGNITPVQAPSTAWGIDFAPSASSGSYVTIANNGTYDLAIGSGFIYLYDETAASGVAQIACYYGSTTIVWQNGTYYTIASGTASKINVYYNSGTGKYRIQNTTGASRSMWISTFKMRVSS